MGAVADRSTAVGIRQDAVTEWFVASVAGVEPPMRFELVAGGRSNLTFRVDDAAGHSFALRRPPVSHVLPTAHDMAREHRILRALFPTAVPVPRPLGLCDDPEVTGAPFYVMRFVEGLVLRDAATAEADMADLAARRAAGEQLADILATLHRVNVDDVGLGDLARREGYIERQLRRWSSQFAQTSVAGVTAPGGANPAPAGDHHRARGLPAGQRHRVAVG
jgi:aminoglycoside phosphotransferase (APT) family kinase protein